MMARVDIARLDNELALDILSRLDLDTQLCTVPLVSRAWRALAWGPSRAFHSLQLAHRLHSAGPEEAFQATYRRLEACGGCTTSLTLVVDHDARTEPGPGRGPRQGHCRAARLSEDVCSLALALPRLRICQLITAPMDLWALACLVQHPSLEALAAGLWEDVDPEQLEALGAVCSPGLASLALAFHSAWPLERRLRTCSALVVSSICPCPRRPPAERGGRLLTALAGFGALPQLRLENTPELFGEHTWLGMQATLPPGLSRVTNLCALRVTGPCMGFGASLAPLVRLTAVAMSAQGWDEVAAGLEAVPALSRLELALAARHHLPAARLGFLAGLTCLKLDVVHASGERPPCPPFAQPLPAAGGRLELPQLRTLEVTCEVFCAALRWASLTRLERLHVCLYSQRIVHLPLPPDVLGGLVELHLAFCVRAPRGLRHATALTSLILEYEHKGLQQFGAWGGRLARRLGRRLGRLRDLRFSGVPTLGCGRVGETLRQHLPAPAWAVTERSGRLCQCQPHDKGVWTLARRQGL